MSDKPKEPVNINFNVDPLKVPVLSVDNYLIQSNERTMVLNFSQSVLDGTQQNIVSRVAMTPAQAKAFLVNLNDHIEKFEV